MTSIWLHRYTKLLVATTFLLIIAGGLVTSTGSGLAVPDWPLSYGQLMPPMVGGIFYEHLHRMVAASVGIMTLVLAIWVGIVEKRKWLRWVAIGALGAVVLQGILGGMTVLFLLPAPISIFHACLAQTFFALMVSISFFTSKEWSSGTSRDRGEGLKKLSLMTTALIFAQLILGATTRHTESSFVVISHVLGAVFVLIQTVLVVLCVLRNETANAKLVFPAVGMGAIVAVQLVFGMGSFVFTEMMKKTIQPTLTKVIFVTIHQSLGALLLAFSVFFLLRILRVSKAI
jgi:heme a synthase